jgi:hypothetical protein
MKKMKKLLLSVAFLFVSIALISPNVNAQAREPKRFLNNLPVSGSDDSESKVLAPTSKAEIRAYKNFSKNYKNISKVSWYYSGKILVASFSEQNAQKRVMYSGNGHWLRTLITYDESQLSDYVKSMVEREYPKFKITNITEVHERDMIAFFVNLENEKEIKQVISYEDKVWTHRQFKKA